MVRRRTRALTIGLALVLVASACSSGGSSSGASAKTTTTQKVTFTGNVSLQGKADVAKGCDPLQQHSCLLPFPSDAYTVASKKTDTGRLVALQADQLPKNSKGQVWDPTEWNRNDGFSPGTPIYVWAPTADLAKSGAAPITDLAKSVSDSSPTLIIDTETGKRVPHWVELDQNTTNPDQRLLIIRPAVQLTDGHHFVVGIRNLKDANGKALEADEVFRAYRDRLKTDVPQIEARRPQMEQDLAALADAGVDRSQLWLAWDFTVASERNLTERMLHLRDDAFAKLGDKAPAFTVTGTTKPTGSGDEAANVAYYVNGTFRVPNYLTGTGAPGSRFDNGPDGLPQQNGQHPEITAKFECTVPKSAVAPGAKPAGGVVYGHGLLGSRDEVTAHNIQLMTNEHDLIYCATDWLGMSEEDVSTAISILSDLGTFPELADRTQQGMLDALYLGRLMIRPDGLVSDKAFQNDGKPILDIKRLVYDGNSQGAIMGGALTAVAQDWTRSTLGVTGMDYALLLQRSKDFDTYSAVLTPAYPNEMDRLLGIGLIQMLWDRGEADGYAQQMTDHPLPGTPKHTVLLHVAFGDFQVADVTGLIEARTIGARYHSPLLAPGRGQIDYTYGLKAIGKYPYTGSAIVMWDSGVPAPPLGNVHPTGAGDPKGAHDPHEDPRMMPTARDQKATFFETGEIVDVCNGQPCTANRV